MRTTRTIEELIESMEYLESKYQDLVWYARKSNRMRKENPKTRAAMLKVERKYPEEITNLTTFETGDWEHGFNSGMLAGMRYLITQMEEGKEIADKEFPELDS